LEKLQHAEDIVGIQQWNHVLWNQQKYPKNKFKFGDHVLWGSQKDRKHIGKLTKKWVGPYKVQLCLPNNTIFWSLWINLTQTLCLLL
jgi:hypothetical protein